MKLKYLKWLMVSLLLAAVVGAALISPPAAIFAQTAPSYGSYQFDTGSYTGVASTVAEELLAAPGTGYRWVITGVNYEVLVAEASKVITILDHSGSEAGGTGWGTTTSVESVVVCEFAPTIAGGNAWHDFGEGVECAVNSAVLVEGISTTADVWVEVHAYKEKVPE